MFKHSRAVRSTLLLATVPVLMMACAQGHSTPESDADDPVVSSPVQGAAAAEIAEPTLPEQLRERFEMRLAAAPAGTVKGRVIGLDDQPVAGITVKIGDRETVSGADGGYTLDEVPNGNHVLTFEHPEYVLTQRAVGLGPGEEPWVVGRILRRGAVHRVDVGKVEIVREGALSLEFEPGDLVLATGKEVTGAVDVVVTTIDPRERGHIDAAPARLEGVTASGAQVGLISYGMLEVEMWQDGKKVQVRPGQTVKTSMNVTGGMPIEAGDAIPMWHHDTDLGLWVQERGTDARVLELDGELVAVTELPHFSAWNFDIATDAVCANIRIPAATRATALRVISMTSAGAPDNLWSFTSQCNFDGRRGSVCISNVPAGGNGTNVSFRFQAQQEGSTTWADLDTTLNGATVGVMIGSQIGSYLTSNGMSAGSWCGVATPTPGPGVWLSGNYNIGSFPTVLPTNTVRFGLGSSTAPGFTMGASFVTADTGFSTMAVNAKSVTYKNDADRDGVLDKNDNCPFRSNPAQTDADNNKIGDVCEAWCFVPSSLPDASWFDADGDEIDDLCDVSWATSNPSQYKPL
jgi:hypothetical protein